jgi:molybdate transport system substrate-binding protein
MGSGMQLRILSGGAAQGLVDALAPRFKTETGCDIAGEFGAVGAMRNKLLAGEPADLMILSAALIADLVKTEHVIAGETRKIGAVPTAVAVRAGDPKPSISDADALRSALRAADSIYFPDPKLATAGIHFAKVIEKLGLAAEVSSRLRTFPNGQTAMRELAASKSARPIGCTQVTEILNTKGATLAGPLPTGFELSTVYAAGVCGQARLPDEAAKFSALLAGEDSRALRERLGFAGV